MAWSIKEFFQEIWSEYAKRFWYFAAILYVATALSELLREGLLEILASYGVFGFSLDKAAVIPDALWSSILSNPIIIVFALGAAFFYLWGFAALYFSFQGSSIRNSIKEGLRNVWRYAAFVIVASVITFAGFALVSAPAFLLFDTFTDLPLYLADGETLNYVLVIPLAILFGIPAIYLWVAFSPGPFILLFEKVSVLQALGESMRRINPHWWRVALILLAGLLMAGAAYAASSWLIFSLKLMLAGDLSFRSETILRIFLYIIPWVVAASFFDFLLYGLYRKTGYREFGGQNMVIDKNLPAQK